LNRTAPGYRLYQVGFEQYAYFADGEYLGDHFGRWRYARVLDKLGDPRALAAEVRSMGAGYVMLPRTPPALPLPPSPELTPRFANAAVAVYALTDDPRSASGSPWPAVTDRGSLAIRWRRRQ
jgi:hypothetical protein